jgi:glycosyltransferase involved in cell wall biosynthesis
MTSSAAVLPNGASDPRFSVLLPTFNSARFIRNAIESFLEQTFRAAELIAVDDGSQDDTVSILRDYDDPRIRVLEQPHRGTAAARNFGLQSARGVAVVLLDHDDELHPCFLERIAVAWDRDPDAAVVFTDVFMFDDRRGKVLPQTLFQTHPPPESVDLRSMLRRNYIPARAAVRRDVAVELGGFDEGLSGADDYVLWLRVAAAKLRFRGLYEPLVYYRIRPGSQGSDRARMAERYAEILTWALNELPLDAAARRECELRLGAARERIESARGIRALQEGHSRLAVRHFATAWRESPLRWRSIRTLYFALEGLIRPGHLERVADESAPAVAMRLATPSDLPRARPSRRLITQARKAIAWETARLRRSAVAAR